MIKIAPADNFVHHPHSKLSAGKPSQLIRANGAFLYFTKKAVKSDAILFFTKNASMKDFSLEHHFLIAMPNMQDPIFARSIVFICEHSARGAMGIIVNRPSEMTVQDLFEQVNIRLGRLEFADHIVHLGGPVQPDRGFVLHQPRGEWNSSYPVSEQTALTSSRDILLAMQDGAGPDKAFISLGYAGWDAGQLEHEISQNAWLTVSAPEDLGLIFETPLALRYDAALKLLGVDRIALTEDAGHA